MKSGGNYEGGPNYGLGTKATQTWQDIGKGFSAATTLANTGLGIYSALNPNKPGGGSTLGGSSIGAGVGRGDAVAGNASGRLQPIQMAQVGSGGAGGGGGQGQVAQRPTNDKHLDILRQLLGVYQG